MKKIINFYVAFFVLSQPLLAEDKYAYPELLVTPSATDRLKREAKDEDKRMFKTHLAMQASALTTLFASFSLASDKGDKKDVNKDQMAKTASMVGMAIGGGWLGVTTLMSFSYTPYDNGWRDVKKMSPKSDRDKLERERMAEEYLENPAVLGNRLEWLSMLTNFAAGGLMVASARQEENKMYSGLAILMSFSPFVFNYHWEDVYDKHEDYKKRIYGPIAQASFLFNEETGKFYPGIVTGLVF